MPRSWFTNPASLYEDLGVEIVAEITLETLAHAVFALCWEGPDRDVAAAESIFLRSQKPDWPLERDTYEEAARIGLRRREVMRRATYLAYAEVAVIEESPVRRASPAAIEASKITNRILLAGTGGVGASAGASALVHGADTGPMVVVIGAGVTLVLAIAGGGITMLWHWLGKRLDV